MKTFHFNQVIKRAIITCLFISCGIGSYAAIRPQTKIITYPAPAGEQLDQRYKVAVEGRDVAVYTAKVADNDKPDAFKGFADIPNSQKYFASAAFAYFDMQGSATVTVTVPNAVTSAKILPASANITAAIHGNTITFPVSSPKNLTIEINGEWVRSLHLFINPLETNIPNANDPNVIYFGPGIHTISTLNVGNNKTIYIAGGAIVRAGIDSGEKYTVNANSTERHYAPSILLRGRNITIRGRGIIDASACPPHSRNLLFIIGKQINVEGIILREGSTWNVPIRQSDSVTVDNIKILGFRPNSDGIDICNSRYVTVKNCFVRSMDDLIVLKADKHQGDCQHITVTKCVLWNQVAHALSIGAEVSDNVDDVTFSNCDIIHDSGREWSLRVFQSDAGIISNVRFENIRIEEAHRFISLWIGHSVWSADKDFGRVQGISFKNITAIGSPLTVELAGADADHGVSDVTFQNILVNGQPLTQNDVKTNAFVRDVMIK